MPKEAFALGVKHHEKSNNSVHSYGYCAASPTFVALGVQGEDLWPLPLNARPLTQQIVIEQCREPFNALMQDVNAKAELVREAGLRGANSNEVCRLMKSYEEAEHKMIRFIGINAEICGVLRDFREHVRTNHLTTERMKEKACAREWQFG